MAAAASASPDAELLTPPVIASTGAASAATIATDPGLTTMFDAVSGTAMAEVAPTSSIRHFACKATRPRPGASVFSWTLSPGRTLWPFGSAIVTRPLGSTASTFVAISPARCDVRKQERRAGDDDGCARGRFGFGLVHMHGLELHAPGRSHPARQRHIAKLPPPVDAAALSMRRRRTPALMRRDIAVAMRGCVMASPRRI